jgi:hypothetical protein
MELQTAEDIHILCLFENYENLQSFYNCIDFANISNRAEIFGEQLILDEDDNILGKESRMLLVASEVSVEKVVALAKDAGLVLTPAGASFPYGADPDDTNIRIAPSYPTLPELEQALELLCTVVKLVCNEAYKD